MKENKGLWMQGETKVLCLPEGGQTSCAHFEPVEGRRFQCKYCDQVTYECLSKECAVDVKSEEILEDL